MIHLLIAAFGLAMMFGAIAFARHRWSDWLFWPGLVVFVVAAALA